MLVQLFISFLKIGLLGFGGGLSIIALIEREVTRFGWLTPTEFVDIVAISQVTPGPVGLNCATYVGYTVTGSIWGALLASFAIILPSLVIMVTLCGIYRIIRDRWAENKVFQVVMRMIRILVLVLVASAAYRLCTPESFIDGRSWVIFGGAALLMLTQDFFESSNSPKGVQIFKWTKIISNPIVILLLAGGVGWLIYG